MYTYLAGQSSPLALNSFCKVSSLLSTAAIHTAAGVPFPAKEFCARAITKENDKRRRIKNAGILRFIFFNGRLK